MADPADRAHDGPADDPQPVQGPRDRVVIITGSTRGIGWTTAEVFAESGAQVVVTGTTDTAVERAENLTERFGVETLGLSFDVSDSAAVKEAFRSVHTHFGQIDVLVNNAGILEAGMVGMITDDVLRRMVDVNLIGTINCLQLASRFMQRRRLGTIVNVSSILGTQGAPGQVAYAATKSAVVGVTLSAAKELAPFGIRVNAVAPGYISTDMTADIPSDVPIRLGRLGDPVDVANAIAFLASDEAGYVTGQVLGVDGGMLI